MMFDWRVKAVLAALSAAAVAATAPVESASNVPESTNAPIGWIDLPVHEATFSRTLEVAGWALDRRGIRAVDVRIAGKTLATTYGSARSDVAAVRPGYPDAERSGYRLVQTLHELRPLRHPFEVVATNQAGASAVLGKRSLVPAEAMDLWTGARAPDETAAFHFLMATSGIGQGGASEVAAVYHGYASRTQRVGVAVPILYLRTTRGRAQDWTFDPAFDTTRKCGTRVLAEDSLERVLRYAVDAPMPIQIILNGGIWADATCNAPDWDLNDHLEEDPRNCQWTQDDRVYPDDHLKNLAGSTASPELARSLTLNVYARDVRRYKKRNLQAAAGMIAKFAREHPELFVGVNLDSDTYLNPFFAEREWFDYNPGTLRQFREWLRGDGPYAGRPDDGAPDLRAFRRARPLSLDDVNRLAKRKWTRWDEVDPPRRFPGSAHAPAKPGERPIFDDPWYREWDTFRKHLVALHYDELAQWTFEAGIAKDRIFTAQGFVAPRGAAKPFAIRIDSSGQNYDSGGVSIEGSIPRNGHLGAILYGAAAENRVRMAHRHGLFATFARMDPGWAVVESNLAELEQPAKVPTYAQAYRAFRDLFNYDAKQVSLMAWNGSNGIYAGQPGYVAYTSWRNTPAEEAMRDHIVSHAELPLGSRLWTFGSAQHADDDGWTAEGASLHAERARLVVRPRAAKVALVSPADQVVRKSARLVVGIDPASIARIDVFAETAPGSAWTRIGGSGEPGKLVATTAGIQLPLTWPKDAIAERVRIELVPARKADALHIDRIAVLR